MPNSLFPESPESRRAFGLFVYLNIVFRILRTQAPRSNAGLGIGRLDEEVDFERFKNRRIYCRGYLSERVLRTDFA